MAQEGIDAQVLFCGAPHLWQESGDWFGSGRAGDGENQLSSRQSAEYDIWAMQFFPYG